jgi:hypothetical protein
MDKKRRRNENDNRIYEKIGFYEKQKKKEDTKIPVANTIPKNNLIPNQNYPKVHFLNPNLIRN